MAKGAIRHMFPGNNTSRGFYSYYDYILQQEQAERIFIIKGGPGVGKSTFMKRSAADLVREGYDVEFMHCSSDPESLDGLVVPALKVAMIDGTAPHVVDPKNPGAVDEIIHLGDFWDEEGMRNNREGILKENAEVGRLFGRAYRYLAAAACVYSDNEEINKRAVNRQKVTKEVEGIVGRIFAEDSIAECEGSLRKLFATAITPDGFRSHLITVLNTEEVIVLKGAPGTGTERILQKLMEEAVEKGYYVEGFYCALHPERPEHVVIPEKGVSITTSSKYHTVLTEGKEVIDLNQYPDREILMKNRDVIDYNRLEFEGLLNRAVMTIEQAKKLHDHMETYYIPNMDFDAVEKCRRETVERVLEYKQS